MMAIKPALSLFQPVASTLGSLKGVLWTVVLASGVINLLVLTGSFYMLQVYDRVLTSYSVPTLLALSLLALGLYAIQGLLEITRGRLLTRIAARVDREIAGPAHSAAVRMPLYGRSTGESLQIFRDVDAIRGFVSGQSLVALIDLPWFPLYLGFVFLLHYWLGWMATVGALVLIGVTFLTERLTRRAEMEAATASISRLAIAEANVRNADVLAAMGLGGEALSRYQKANAIYIAQCRRVSDWIGLLGGLSKVFRLALQSAILGLGAYLTIRGEMSAGAIIAASIASSRALAPIELAIANWKAFTAARQSNARLQAVSASLPSQQVTPLPLPAPKRAIALENISVPIPGTQRMALSNATLSLNAGQALGVIGPSAAGKSTLARAITGIWPLAHGTIRIDGAALDRWTEAALGQHIGYLPQDVELFDVSIAENIARLDANADPAAVLAAAKAAHVHDMILGLPDGYETRAGDRGKFLSAGQRQRIALARALYRDPFLVVLDEPNSNLDGEGDAALMRAIDHIRARGGIVVVIAHRPSIVAAVDMLAVVGGGRLTAFGPREEVLRKAVKTPPAAGAGKTLSLVSDQSA